MAGRVAYYGGIVKDGLVLNLDAAKKDSYPGTGTTWRDISGNQNNGTLVNGPTFDSGNGGSIVFDGVDDTTNLGNILNIGLNNLTLSCWVQILNGTGPRGIVGKTSARSFEGRYAIFIESNFIRTIFQASGAVYLIQTPITNYINTGFHNITMVIDRSSFMRLYINNIEVGTPINVSSTSNVNLNTSTDIFFVGSYATSTGLLPTFFFNGNIANVQMYHKALTPDEIQQNYNATKGRYGL
jgi:hypothetical protein